MTPAEFANRMNNMTSQQIGEVMERLPTDVLEFAVRFEAAGMTHAEEYDNFVGGDDDFEDGSELCRRCNDWPCCCNELRDGDEY
jgi:hypothetical protein